MWGNSGRLGCFGGFALIWGDWGGFGWFSERFVGFLSGFRTKLVNRFSFKVLYFCAVFSGVVGCRS